MLTPPDRGLTDPWPTQGGVHREHQDKEQHESRVGSQEQATATEQAQVLGVPCPPPRDGDAPGNPRSDHVDGCQRGRRPGVQPQRLRPALHPQADQDRRAARGHATAANPCGTLRRHRGRTRSRRGSGRQLPWGLRTVDGTCNNLVPGRTTFGAADQNFPRAWSSPAESRSGRPTAQAGAASYTQTTGTVIDSQPRVISNLIVDQTATNPAAVAAAGDGRRGRRRPARSSSRTWRPTSASPRRTTPGSRSSASSSTTAWTW